ncbi:predicted GPI-anchored protein 58 [Electrophorus electricus]|uniref:predicted GPI-anchored protein 58 n=1 Tax=Electrophorus electricus TaxID=8005 RepID=UPI0015D02BEF|nr:predicted GPI-anchored protein 58 [Electrophorus electricus]
MRPRSRLLAKRGLPTIREGYEELVQDLNQTNSQHTSTQDYFHSICQLARPTFPLREPDCDILSIGTLDSPKPCLRPPRLRQPLRLPPPPAAASAGNPVAQPPGGEEEEPAGPASRESSPAQGPEQGGAEGPGSADPLEYLYGHRAPAARRGSIPPPRRARSDSFPRLGSAPDAQRKGSCPELRLAEPGLPPAIVLQRSPLSRKKLEDGPAAVRGGKLDGAPAGWRGRSGRCMDKQTMVSHWIAECRSAWREARIRACMLPAIAEK